MVRRISIVIPAFNEVRTVEELLVRVARAPLPGDLEREIVVVDDCSTDGTRDLLRELERRADPPFRLSSSSRSTRARAPRCAAASPTPPATSS